MTETHYPTGEQFDLVWPEHGVPRAHAVVTAVGAILRVLEFDQVPVLQGFAVDAAPAFCAGWMLAPWPNRVRDGVWNDNGTERHLPITEPERGNALHGFLFEQHHTVIRRTESSIVLRASIPPTDGYPFALTIDTAFQLGENALTVTYAVTNGGDRPAPVALGAHPYFTIGDVPVDDLVVTVRAATRVLVDDRMNSIGSAPVDGTPFDLRHGAPVRGLELDTAYFDLEQGADGRYRHTIEAPDARRIEVWGDESYSHSQVFTTDIFPTPNGLVRALTVEPTTAPPDALNSGVDLKFVEPGATWTSSWGITFVPAATPTTPATPEDPEDTP